MASAGVQLLLFCGAVLLPSSALLLQILVSQSRASPPSPLPPPASRPCKPPPSTAEEASAQSSTSPQLLHYLRTCRVVVEMQTEERIASISSTMGRVLAAGAAYGFRVSEPFTADSRFLPGSHSCLRRHCAVPLSFYLNMARTAGNGMCQLTANHTASLRRFVLRRAEAPASPPGACVAARNASAAALEPFWCPTDKAAAAAKWPFGRRLASSPSAAARKPAAAPHRPAAARPRLGHEQREVCVHACVHEGRCNLWRPLGAVVHAAIRFVWRELGEAAPFVVSLEKRGWWYGLPGPSYAWELQPQLLRLAARIGERYLQCSRNPTRKTVAASLRIAYDAGRRWRPEQTRAICEDNIARLHHAIRALGEPTSCPNYLSTDWFALADGRPTGEQAAALEACWDHSMNGGEEKLKGGKAAEVPGYFWLSDNRMILMLMNDMPNLRRALAEDAKGFRAFLDIAMLTTADICFGNGHMASSASRVRLQMGKPPCSSLPRHVAT